MISLCQPWDDQFHLSKMSFTNVTHILNHPLKGKLFKTLYIQPANLWIHEYSIEIPRDLWMFSTSKGLHFPQLSGHLDIAVGCLCCSQAETKRRVAWSERWPGWFGNEKGWRDIISWDSFQSLAKIIQIPYLRLSFFDFSVFFGRLLKQGPKVCPKNIVHWYVICPWRRSIARGC